MLRIILALLDTGLRIDEAFTLKHSRFDFDNLYLTVLGKQLKLLTSTIYKPNGLLLGTPLPGRKLLTSDNHDSLLGE